MEWEAKPEFVANFTNLDLMMILTIAFNNKAQVLCSTPNLAVNDDYQHFKFSELSEATRELTGITDGCFPLKALTNFTQIHKIIPKTALPRGLNKNSVMDLKQAVFNGPYKNKSWSVVELLQEGFPRFSVKYGYDFDQCYDGFYMISLVFYNSNNERLSSLQMCCDDYSRIKKRSIKLTDKHFNTIVEYGVTEDGDLVAK